MKLQRIWLSLFSFTFPNKGKGVSATGLKQKTQPLPNNTNYKRKSHPEISLLKSIISHKYINLIIKAIKQLGTYDNYFKTD